MKSTVYAKRNTFGRAAASLLFAVMIGVAGAAGAFGQGEAVATTQMPESTTAVVSPVVTDVRGVSIGMTADEVKEKLGKAKMMDASSMYYEFGDGESLQISLDADKKVRMAAAIYLGKKADAPEYAMVFGPDAAVQPSDDGRIYNLVNYPEAGYWVAYNYLMAGDDPMTTVTIQVINQ